jgi:hypothetical protein
VKKPTNQPTRQTKKKGSMTPPKENNSRAIDTHESEVGEIPDKG